MKTFAIAAATMLAIGTSANAADRHIDDLAFDVQNQTAALVREIRYGYRHHPEFAHLYEDAIEMANHAAAIHRIAHHHTPVAHLSREVSALDELFHHVEEVIDEANRTGAYNVNRYHAGRAMRVMALLEDTIHHLLEDLTPAPVYHAPVHHAPVHHAPVRYQPTIVNPRPVIYTPQYGGSQGGFTYRSNNGRFTIRLGH